MAFTTSDLNIRPEDGWTLVATNPSMLIIKPDAVHPWWLAITSGGEPDAGVVGLPYGRGHARKKDEFFLDVAITGSVYIRVATPVASEPTTQQMWFGIIADAE